MGPDEEKEWVNVANDLLTKCNLNLHVNSLSDCVAEVFTRLYESILGESVPDFIAVPSCQEDDAHNVQAVIDSLALDYLQVSLSHITDGFNQMAEDEVQHHHLGEQEGGQEISVPSLELPSVVGSPLSLARIPSEEEEGSESTSELIKLGDTAYLFSLRNEGLPSERETSVKTMESEEHEGFRVPSDFPSRGRSVHFTETKGAAKSSELSRERLSSSAKKLGEPIRPAIPLQPPYQPSVPRMSYPTDRSDISLDRHSPTSKPQYIASDASEPPEEESATLSGGLLSQSRMTSDHPTGDEQQTSEVVSDKVTDTIVPEDGIDSRKETNESCQYTPTPCFESTLPTSLQSTRPKQRNLVLGKSQNESWTDSLDEEPLPHRKAKEKLSRQELHHMSQKLSRQLNELDAMLKHALGERTQEESSSEEDQLSQHSDSVMDYRQRKPATARLKKAPSRQRSLSASPPPSSHLLSALDNVLQQKDAREPAGNMCEHLRKEEDQRNIRAKLLAKAYDDELRAYEASERLEVAKLKAKAKETEQKYKQCILKGPPRTSQAAKIYSQKSGPRNPKLNQWISRGGFAKPKKAIPLKVKENELLPKLLEDFPHLQISRPTMNRMWQQQVAQIDQLKSPINRSRQKLQNEVLETLKKHELLADLIKKEQTHNRRLQEFKQRIHRQKYTENKVRDRRQQIVRAKKYYQDYRVQLRAKMMRARTREERIFKSLFEEGLEIQKQRLHELRAYAKEKRAEQRKQHQDELESMENYYKNQFSMLAEAVSAERHEIQTREKAHANTLNKVKRELRSKMEKEIKELQDMIMQNDDDTFFRELEADRLKSRLLVASFQYNKNYQFL
ncbi:centrosomal protein of 95 kDa isoform X2 [Anolis carolinensis]|uniref:centrosomal protein of 95 kDa isoform X2 n=1 Tax=Anolis carolinensis TaxID=28377 RepID=UPI00046261E2|nr:PREDICTED: centrosomal protein of 95 kDa isoform X2 [Anolis carolinensis]|eukprot:XP_008114591.1 PREDICTED: centrosomal protein of 95 kDa isoform X2 [Anolis carolinensis]